jgi:hypothetical protein
MWLGIADSASVYSTGVPASMENGIKLSAHWDNACPEAVSYLEHLKSLPVHMSQLFFTVGYSGCFLIHPIIAAMLSTADPERYGPFRWDKSLKWPLQIFELAGIPVWVEPAIPTNEILIVEEASSVQPFAKLTISNFTDGVGPLDRLAEL